MSRTKIIKDFHEIWFFPRYFSIIFQMFIHFSAYFSKIRPKFRDWPNTIISFLPLKNRTPKHFTDPPQTKNPAGITCNAVLTDRPKFLIKVPWPAPNPWKFKILFCAVLPQFIWDNDFPIGSGGLALWRMEKFQVLRKPFRIVRNLRKYFIRHGNVMQHHLETNVFSYNHLKILRTF